MPDSSKWTEPLAGVGKAVRAKQTSRCHTRQGSSLASCAGVGRSLGRRYRCGNECGKRATGLTRRMRKAPAIHTVVPNGAPQAFRQAVLLGRRWNFITTCLVRVLNSTATNIRMCDKRAAVKCRGRGDGVDDGSDGRRLRR